MFVCIPKLRQVRQHSYLILFSIPVPGCQVLFRPGYGVPYALSERPDPEFRSAAARISMQRIGADKRMGAGRYPLIGFHPLPRSKFNPNNCTKLPPRDATEVSFSTSARNSRVVGSSDNLEDSVPYPNGTQTGRGNGHRPDRSPKTCQVLIVLAHAFYRNLTGTQ